MNLFSLVQVFVEALNSHGIGDPSPRIVFRTAMPQKHESKFTGYDQDFCCKSIGVRDECEWFFSLYLYLKGCEAI